MDIVPLITLLCIFAFIFTCAVMLPAYTTRTSGVIEYAPSPPYTKNEKYTREYLVLCLYAWALAGGILILMSLSISKRTLSDILNKEFTDNLLSWAVILFIFYTSVLLYAPFKHGWIIMIITACVLSVTLGIKSFESWQ